MTFIIEQRPDLAKGMTFTQVFLIEANQDSDDEALVEIRKMAEWCACRFSQNYILLAVKTTILSGGTADPTNQPWMPHELPSSISHFELRCHEQDATLFKLSWM